MSDPYTMSLRLCDDSGQIADGYLDVLNRLRALGGHDPYVGASFACTGNAHLAGEHIHCTSPAHGTSGHVLAAVRDVRLFIRWASRCDDHTSRDSLLWDAIVILREVVA